MTGDALLPRKFNGPGSKPRRAQAAKDARETTAPPGSGGVSAYFGAACPGWVGEHGHSDLVIILPLGAAEFDLTCSTPEGIPEQQRLREGQIALIDSGHAHTGLVHDPAGLVRLHLAAPVAAKLSGRNFTGIAVHDFPRLARDDLVLWDLAHVFRRLARESAPRPARYVASVASVFATHLFAAHFRAGALAPDTRCLTPAQLRTVTDFIGAHLKETLTTEMIARQVHLSVFHFTRLFKGTTGLAPHRYLIQCRVIRAQELLRTGNFRVAEAAYELGFCDQSHLDRQFRRHFGFPPKLLLKQHRAQE